MCTQREGSDVYRRRGVNFTQWDEHEYEENYNLWRYITAEDIFNDAKEYREKEKKKMDIE